LIQVEYFISILYKSKENDEPMISNLISKKIYSYNKLFFGEKRNN